jgi:hypothetical protein
VSDFGHSPAFPIRGMNEHPGPTGLTVRDYFAAKAMQAFISSYPNGSAPSGGDEWAIAEDAYDMADAMLKAREA